MAVSGLEWRPVTTEGLQVLAGDPVGGVAAECALEAASRFDRFAEAGKSHAEPRPHNSPVIVEPRRSVCAEGRELTRTQ